MNIYGTGHLILGDPRNNKEGTLVVTNAVFDSEEHPKLMRRLSPAIDHFNCRCNIGTKAYNPIQRVIFNNPATIVFWKDGTKTVVKCGDNDAYDREKGLAMAIAKKFLGNKGNFNNIFKKYLKEEEK